MAVNTFIAYQTKPYMIHDEDEYPDCIPSIMVPIPFSWIGRQILKLIFAIFFVSTVLWLLPFDHTTTSLHSITFNPLQSIIHDLTDKGIIKTGNKALIVAGENHHGPIVIKDDHNYNTKEMTLNSTPAPPKEDFFDFIFTKDFQSSIDKSLKVGGVLTLQLSNNPKVVFKKPNNYRTVYLRHYGSTFMTMRKTSHNKNNKESPSKRKLLGAIITSQEAKKAALKNLEDALLEPPRGTLSGKSNKRFLKRTKYLPDLLGDSFENYPRRIFIDVDLSEHKNKGYRPRWFEKHYPTRNKDFDIYKVEAVDADQSEEGTTPQIGMSDWLRRNVKEEEYVVMKAEAEVVEEMVKNGVLGLVDELFLECKHQGMNGNTDLSKIRKGRRAYWQCLALYGRLMDEGVAVHQWWG
ncbi:uncharacterized protein LOC124930259 [Impatiens glandulifera]|uniref:uncharacterized protein LOC124930259 n=1 Tax=Impatiens glandulifera TaxID=253017 RepID=UPI001FB0B325|nr:uncharacterized protein LOC124930259 [Impatiens glandulifera]